jgi:hypothetical protein
MPQTMIVASSRQFSPLNADENSIVVTTPLDAIVRLEKSHPIATVVLVGAYATNRELVAFLTEFYPSIRLVQLDQLESEI